MNDTPELKIEATPVGTSGKFDVVVRIPGGSPVVDQFKLAVDVDRERFADKVCRDRHGIDRDELISVLSETAAAEIASAQRHTRHTSQASELVALVLGVEGVELFHTPEGEVYVTMPVDDHRETTKLSTKAFREWLTFLFFRENQKTPNSQALQDAIVTISGYARYEGKERAVHLRVAEHEGAIWLDLCDSRWRAVRVDKTGWDVVSSDAVPVRFVRRKGMQALPDPERSGSIDELRPLLNMPRDEEWTLTVGWMVGALHPSGPYGVLSISGEHGSAKSTTSKLIRRVIDPNLADLRRPPREERDAFISAGNSWVSAYNNLSGISSNLSDALCALATDGGFATRTLYADDDESIFSTRRPVILNGIEPPASRPDLVDRTISITLKTISEEVRREERDIFVEFDRIHGRVLGGLLDALVSALRNRDRVRLRRLPRMADLAVWVTAAESGLGWEPGRFVNAYFKNRSEANDDVVESSLVSVALARLFGQGPFRGTWTELLSALNRLDGVNSAAKDWPPNHMKLRSEVLRLAPNLRAVGYTIELPDGPSGHGNRRELYLESPLQRPVGAVAALAEPDGPSATEPTPEEWAELEAAQAKGASAANALTPTQSPDAHEEVAS